MQTTKGFTLLEALLTLAVFGILVALAYPTFLSVQHKARRADAHAALALDQIALERCYAQGGTYKGHCAEALHFPHVSTQGYYKVSLSAIAPQYFLLSATPLGRQAADKVCQVFELNQANQKAAYDRLGADQPDCWI